MTKRNEATTKPCTLNLERMTHDYFYPDLFADDFTNVPIPTTSELLFLGANNLRDIRMVLRHEEKKFRRVQNEVRKAQKDMALATPDKLRKSCLRPNGQPVACNWRGLGYAKIPDEVASELLSNGDDEAYSRVQNERMRKVHTCRFGKDVAEWCKMNPQPCFPCQCYSATQMVIAKVTTGTITVGETDMSVSSQCEEIIPEKPLPKCANYDKCYGVEPLKHESCIFATASQETIDDCKNYLQNRIADLQKRLDFIGKYLKNISTALAHGQQKRRRPSFSLNSFTHLCGAEPGDAIVEIEPDGKVTYGVFVCFTKDERDERIFLLNMQDGRSLKVSYRLRTETLYMTKTAFDYLVEDQDFRTVWTKMTYELGHCVNEPGIMKALATR